MTFYDFTSPVVPPSGVPDFGDVHERAVVNGARHGTPVLVGPGGRPDSRVNLFFRTGAMAGARPSTWRRYAYALVVWLNYLDSVGRGWWEATARDVEAFKEWRLSAVANAGRVQPTSFDTDRAALNSFYCWADQRFGVANPVASVTAGGQRGRGPSGGAAGGSWSVRDPLRPAGATRRQVKWMLRQAFEQWRDIGLCGYDFDGLRRRGWRGGNEDRDAAFVDGLYGTGLRLTEWASVLDVEVPEPSAQRFVPAHLAAACIKGGRAGRTYRIPRTVLRSVAGYTDSVAGSRIHAIRRAQKAGRYERLTGIRIVVGYRPQSRHLLIEDDRGGVDPVSLDVLGPDERRQLFRRTKGGLEPLWLWLAPSGVPKKPHGWEDTFDHANDRVASVWTATVGDGRDPAACPLWARPHMLRHSFCLRWYSILSAVWRSRVAGLSEEQMRDLRDQLGDIWFQLAALMGHAHPMTTRETYLEPFAGLEFDYLMALLDEDETAGVDSLLHALADAGGRTVQPVSITEADGR
ncbi:site-specific integrase [Tsukamurella pseudospumae]|uniref:site-specific integrase n=1 Tax=Tsukamurella pseudospumae TaxID=239498 RepID=UPI001C2F1623|nr:site-specific integrase [Tsukamurella pseudospumae]